MIEDDFFREEVEVSLRQASDGELVRIMQFIDRLPSRARLDDVVAPLRGRLALVRPARSLTLTRVLTLPVEDLLVDPACEEVSAFVLPRDALTALHQLALDGVGRSEAAVLEEEAAQGATMDDRAAVLAVGRRLWPMAEAAIRRFLAALAAGSAPVLPVGWRPAHRDRLAMAADLLRHAETLTGFTDRLPLRPMPAPAGDSRAAACALLAWAGGVSADMQRAALTILLRRADDPAAIAALMAQEDCGMTAGQRQAAQTAAAAECLREVEILAATTETESNVFADADRIHRLAALAGSVQGAAPLLERAGLAARRDAALDAAATLAAARFAGALAGPAAQAFDAVLPANDSAANDDDAASAEAAARAVARIAIAGGRLAGEKLADIARPWRDGWRERLLDAAARRDGDGWARLTAVMDGLRLAEIIFGPELAAGIAARIAPGSILQPFQ